MVVAERSGRKSFEYKHQSLVMEKKEQGEFLRIKGS